jgi:hypothetical protein
MCLVNSPVREKSGGEIHVLHDQDIFCICLFGGFSEVERSREDELIVDDHDLVVRNCVGRVNVSLDPGVRQEVSA